MFYDPGTGSHVIIDNCLVERDALNIAEAIKDYDENLEILCLDPARAEGISEEPFVIAERCKDGILRPVFRAWKLDQMVLERIRLSDCQLKSPLKTLDEWQDAAKKERQNRYEEWRSDASDLSASVLRNKKSKYTVKLQNGDTLIFHDDKPTERIESC